MIQQGTRILVPETAEKAGDGFTTGRLIEEICAGDLVYGHDGQSGRVANVTSRRFSGQMIGITYAHIGHALWVTADHLVLTARRVQRLTPSGTWSGIPVSHVDFARRMRREPTPPETHLWSRLRGNVLGVSFRRQHQIGPYIADFYCRSAGLVVEVDGAGTHSSQEAREYDKQRDAYLNALGLRVLRFAASLVSFQTDAVVTAILYALRESVLPDDSGKQWRNAGSLVVGDLLFFSLAQKPVAVTDITHDDTAVEIYGLEVKGACSIVADVCAIHPHDTNAR
jgi:adenine-specific DNA-methyltransferase